MSKSEPAEQQMPEPDAIPVKLARQKQPTTQITISDDQSRGSDFASRKLKAFGKEAQPEKTPGGSNHALDDYQMQLMLLEQQNKKRIMMARQEQDQVYPASSAPAEPFSNPLLEEYQYMSSFEEAALSTVPQINQDTTLLSALDVISKALDLQGESALTVETLQGFASELQSRKNREAPVKPRSQIIHRVTTKVENQKGGSHGGSHGSRGIKERMYLDMPQWVEGASSSRDALVGNLPVHDVPTYLSKHSDVCFVIYRDYDSDSLKKADPDAQRPPKHHTETIKFATKELSTAVERFFEHYGFPRTTDPIELSAPYYAIYHTRTDYLDYFLQRLDDKSRQQFQVILDYVCTQYAEEYNLVDYMTSKGRITYDLISYLFKPGDVVVKLDGQDAEGYQVKSWLEELGTVPSSKGSGRGQSTAFTLGCWNWTFDGTFSRHSPYLRLEVDKKDESEKNINDLEIRPLRYVGNQTMLRLQRRGEWFWKCRIRCMVSYDNNTDTGLQGSNNERYMIDMMMYRELHENKSSHTRFMNTDNLGVEEMKADDPPDDNFIYLVPKMIKGYNLKRKKWVDLQVDKIHEVSWNTRAFDSLVIDRKTKRLIRALIDNQIEAERSTDLISGKGNGLILLLHGGPGTGKTLTAESVAEIAKKPLYPVTCGDIGTEPEAVETYLESVLHIGKTWGCVVLLDEADVFLEQRSLEDLRRNALVSVFLRVLEYYEGILVLTSNRVGTFDEAFKSRIQLAVHYNNLTLDQRTQIWRNFIGRLEEMEEEGIDFDDLHDHITELAQNEMNGREIRNVITTARQYARWEQKQPGQQEYKLNYKVMDEVLQTARMFDKYIQDVNDGLTGDELAAQDYLRRG